MKLQIQATTYNVIDYRNLEEVIKDHYGVEYSVLEAMECGNDSEHAMFTHDLSEYDLEELEKFKNGKNNWMWPDVLLSDLATQNIIPSGHYLIRVSWQWTI